ncbi:MalY/PatB family protein [Amnibacterium flavum]|uniref:cysteine-S-conjugate beta-lyase n=1 Tax=Amnibacterium flavum TaxID=2173173 RepID=A0A2V1HRZ5_9MICO|nr:aminotransferase class I/II-fold pyridoxal phosphate-dependent enzyme [Amnibacterium flavum]PVZ93730.1 aminotransferase [Amnibacterium flavum]
MTTDPHEWDALSADELRGRGSVKWDPSAHPEVLGAWVAEMDFGTAPAVLEAWQESARLLEFGYPAPSLVSAMSEATALWHAEQYGWSVDPADVAPLADVIKGLELAITEFSAPGAPVIVPTPAYMPFLFVPEGLGREVIQVPMLRDDHGGFALDLQRIDAELSAGAGLVILANPGNPTGKVYRRDELVALADLVDSHGARVFSDEIHAPLTLFGNRHVPLASVSAAGARVAITATSASKAWNLPGLKCAQLILSADRDRVIWQSIGPMASHGASTPGIRANTAAYSAGGDWLRQVRDYLENNYAVLLEELAEALPMARVAPLEATYLCWIDLSAYRGDGPADVDFADLLLEEAGVRVNSGAAFGEVGVGHIRLNIATSRPILREIVQRMAGVLVPTGAARGGE